MLSETQRIEEFSSFTIPHYSTPHLLSLAGEKDTGAQRPAFTERLLSRASRNLDSMQATLRNEGAIRFNSFGSTQDVTSRCGQCGRAGGQGLCGRL